MRRLTALLAACLPAAGLLAAAPMLPLPPYVCVGRIVNYEQLNVAMLDAFATISVHKRDGTLLARSAVAAMEDSASNYRLLIPMASTPSPGAATYGEELWATVTYAGKTYTSLAGFTLTEAGRPGEIHVHDLTLCEDENQNGVADEYERIIGQLMAAEGVEGIYDPKADTDGDGVSNYDEYVAGTNPLDPADRFAITGFAPHPEDPSLLCLTFLTARAKTYQLRAADTLPAGEGEWADAEFRERPDASPVLAYSTGAGTPSPIEKTIYVSKEGGIGAEGMKAGLPLEKSIYVPKAQGEAVSRFFRIRIR